MFYCMSCRSQFNEGMSRFGQCPYCGTVSSYAKKRWEQQEFTKGGKFDSMIILDKILKKIKGR